MERLRPFFPKSHGKLRVDDRRVWRGIIFINRNGLRWCDAPREHGPPKTLYNRWKRLGDMGAFARMMDGLASGGTEQKTVMIDATYLKAHRTALGLRAKKGGADDQRGYRRRNRIEIMFGRLKDWRRVATRHDSCAKTFLSAAALAATVMIWL